MSVLSALLQIKLSLLETYKGGGKGKKIQVIKEVLTLKLKKSNSKITLQSNKTHKIHHMTCKTVTFPARTHDCSESLAVQMSMTTTLAPFCYLNEAALNSDHLWKCFSIFSALRRTLNPLCITAATLKTNSETKNQETIHALEHFDQLQTLKLSLQKVRGITVLN